MSSSRGNGDRLSRIIGGVPFDIVLVVLVAAGIVQLMVTYELGQTPLGRGLAVPLLLFAPGYVFISVLYPGARGTAEGLNGRPIERVFLAVASSVVITPAVGLLLFVVGIGVQVTPLVVALFVLLSVLAVLALWRRLQLPVDERFSVRGPDGASGVSALVTSDSRSDWLLNGAVVVVVLVAVASVGYAVAVPPSNEGYTEFYLLTESQSGELVAEGYPTNFTVGESEPLVFNVVNQERETTAYTVVVQQQRIRTVNNSTVVLETIELDRISAQISPGETWRQRHSVEPERTGENMRLTYLLYRGEAPETPLPDSAYRTIYLPINVSR